MDPKLLPTCEDTYDTYHRQLVTMGVLVSSPFLPAQFLIGGTYGYLVPYQERGQ